jgi:hypothetical protein
MPPTLNGTQINSAQDEFVVKKYHVSRFRSQFSNVRSDGYLHLTNKRVIFQAIASDSVIHSEIPIDNVAGINLYHGEYRDWLKLFVFFGVITLLNALQISLIGLSSAASSFMNRSSDGNGMIFIQWGVSLLWLILTIFSRKGDGIFDEEPNIKLSPFAQSIFASLATVAFATMALTNQSLLAFVFAIIATYLAFSTVRTIPRKYSMSLAIVSKGGSSTPIMIAGANASGMVFSAAAQAFEAEPGADAEKLIKELGAIIHDIQTLGEYGVERWK